MNKVLDMNPATRGLGFFKLDHRIFHDTSIKKLSGEGFRLYLWMLMRAWRYLNSDGRIRAAVPYIAAHLPISTATVSRLFLQLKKLNLIKLMKKDQHLGNVWWVYDVFSGEEVGLESPIGENVLSKKDVFASSGDCE
jgi:hypothetical protein